MPTPAGTGGERNAASRHGHRARRLRRGARLMPARPPTEMERQSGSPSASQAAYSGGEPDLRRLSRELRTGVHELGPGLITGVADDDPSGISTYTVTGATYGYGLLWMSLVTLPMNFVVQSLCARIGLVTGRGLADAIEQRYGRPWLALIVGLLLIANVVNIGADLHAIAAVIELLTGVPHSALIAPIGIAIALTEIVVPYARFARYLKIMTLVIFAYIFGAFVAGPDWRSALTGTVVPRVSLNQGMIATVVAILGTTISPYLFFWQASEEVEEEQGRGIVVSRLAPGRMAALLRVARIDVATGMVMANIGFYFVVLTSAATLHASGQTDVETAAQAAEALRPLAGSAASLVFSLGIIGTGLLAVPVLAGSAAYATAELFDWPEGLSNRFRRAPQFYGVIALSTLLGGVLSVGGISEIRALYIAAIVNGIIAPPLLVVILLVAKDRRVLGEHTAGRGMTILGWITTMTMAVAALAFFVTLFM
jgi:NRAMP (natural resistance-associated macrophage protein)-like metal ion transporter